MKLFVCYLTFLQFLWPFGVMVKFALAESTTTTVATTIKNAEIVVTGQTPMAEKLVRYRRQPPVKIIKHVIRSSKRSKPRHRITRPKLRYGPPPSFFFDDQYAYYKPKTQYITSPPTESSSYNFDEFQHLNLESAEFELPPSSYEAQSMDLDLYSHNNDESSYHHAPKQPSKLTADDYHGINFESEHNIQTTYEYTPKQTHKPHQKYGVPKDLEYSTDFNSSPNHFQTSDLSRYHSYQSQNEPSHGSSISSDFGIPESSVSHIPKSHFSIHSTPDISTSLQTYGAPKHPKVEYDLPVSNSGVYDQKIPSTGYDQNYFKPEYKAPTPSVSSISTINYSQNFGKYDYAEPESLSPQHLPTKPQADDIEITYSPSYEINLVSSGNKYQANEHHNQPGNFAEPPEQPTKTYQAPAHPQSHPSAPEIPQQPGTLDDYVPPTHELPLNPQYKKPAFDFPKSSYEVPIYDPAPFDASTNTEHEYYPPNQFEQPHSPEETPYDQQQSSESIQQSVEDTSSRDAHASGSDPSVKSTKTLRRNRKRQRNPLNNSMKHILDVPELKKAFDDAKQNKQTNYPTQQTDADVNASTLIEEKQPFLPTHPGFKQENYYNPTWNPMRIKIPTRTATTQTSIVTTTNSSKSTQQKQIINRPRPRLTPTVPQIPSKQETSLSSKLKNNSSTNIEIVSIEKSRSQSYYDGTLAPPVLTMSNLFNTKLNIFKTPTQPPTIKPPLPALPKQATTNKPYKGEAAAKRTTKSIFNTTHFKTSQNVRDETYYDLAQILPKNHKLF